MNDRIKKMREQIPLDTRLRVLFLMEWLTMNIQPDRQVTDEETIQAHEWAEKMVKWVIADIKEWEANGRPGGIK